MIRRSLFLAGALGLGLLAAPSHAQPSPPPPPPPTYWCVFQCVDGTQGGGPVSSGAECSQFADNQCRWHGGKRMTGLDAYTPPSPYWCSIRCSDGTEGGGPASSQADCDALANQICSGHGTVTAHDAQPNNIANGH
jgi:hypothetical protein